MMSLNKSEYKFLRLVYKMPRDGAYIMRKLRLDEKGFAFIVNGRLKDYTNPSMKYDDIEKSIVAITPKGKAELEAWDKDNRRYRTAVIFSSAALVISLLSLTVSIISLSLR